MSDPLNDQELERNHRLIPQKPPEFPFDMSMPTRKEIKEVVRAARSASAPSPSGVPYTVYKRCTGILQRLWKIIRVIWRRGRIVDLWRFTEGIWIPKEEASKSVDHFRIISLLNTENMIFFGLLSRRLPNYILRNGYIDTSVQKGGIADMPGYLEHTGGHDTTP